MDVLELIRIKGFDACHDWLQSRTSMDSAYGNIVTGVEYMRGSGKFAMILSDGSWKDSLFLNEELSEQRNLVNLDELQLALNNHYYDGATEAQVYREHQAYADELIEGGAVLVVGANVASDVRKKINDTLS